jgi:hypothetical protein
MPTIAAIADPHDDDPVKRCTYCHLTMPERSPSSPTVRRCERCWWAYNRRLFAARDLAAVDPLALVFFHAHGARPGTVTAPH